MRATPSKSLTDCADAVNLERETLRFITQNPLPSSGVDWMGSTLAELLGCTLLTYLGSPGYSLKKPAPETQYPSNIPECVARVLPVVILDNSESQNITSLLSAICRHDLTDYLLHTEDSAYSLVKALLIYIETCDQESLLATDTAIGVRKMLNSWIKPDVPWARLPSAEDVSSALFGNSWQLFYDRPKYDSDGNRFLLGTLVENVRPPFLTALCLAQAAPQYTLLPELS